MGSSYATLEHSLSVPSSSSNVGLGGLGTAAFTTAEFYNAFLPWFLYRTIIHPIPANLMREVQGRSLHCHFVMWPARPHDSWLWPVEYMEDTSSETDASMPALESVHSDMSHGFSTTTPNSALEMSSSLSWSSEHSRYERECCNCMVL